jgi:hypothetical protein
MKLNDLTHILSGAAAVYLTPGMPPTLRSRSAMAFLAAGVLTFYVKERYVRANEDLNSEGAYGNDDKEFKDMLRNAADAKIKDDHLNFIFKPIASLTDKNTADQLSLVVRAELIMGALAVFALLALDGGVEFSVVVLAPAAGALGTIVADYLTANPPRRANPTQRANPRRPRAAA